MTEAKIVQGKEGVDFITNSWRPYGFDKKGRPVDDKGNLMVNQQQLQANAFLSREEWEVLDTAIYEMARDRINA